VGEGLLSGTEFKQSSNSWDWLGKGIYFWEANPHRGIAFAREQAERQAKKNKQYKPWVIGAVIDLGLCLDLTTQVGARYVELAYESLCEIINKADRKLPENKGNGAHNLDCVVINRLHDIIAETKITPAIDSVRGVFIEGDSIYPTSMFKEKTHIQICVCNPECIKGVFRVKEYL